MKIILLNDSDFKRIIANYSRLIGPCSFPLLLFLILNWLYPFRVEVDYSPIVLSEDRELLHGFLTPDDKWRMYTTLDEITPTLKKAIVFKEDQYFYWHFGINPLSILRATFNNTFSGRRTSGASTITMQVARLLEPKERTYTNKLLEIFRAFQLEWQYSKDEILQLYLNLVPFGGNIEGVKSASLLYFQKMPDHLSLAETTTLTIVPNRPNSLRPGRHNGYLQQERNRWLNRFSKSGIFTQQAIDDALEEKLTAVRRPLSRQAPHLSRRLTQWLTHTPIIETSLDLNMQSKAEALVSQHVRRLYHRNIKNAAVIIVENETMQVKAYIGSADYNNAEDAGQVDGIRAIRSPGSTLKPFLYGLAIDRGLITPKTMIADVPVNFKGYQPQNYSETFSGQVTIEKALAQSLNIPAVKVLDQLGSHVLVKSLSEAGFEQIEKDKGHLGLSTVLGGCGVRLEELAGLYAAFANHGKRGKLNYLKKDAVTVLGEVLSVSSNYMISEVLTDVARPDLPDLWHHAENLPKVAWKTGTSFGRRDAWSVGFNKQFTIGVWVGNFSGESVPELNGADIAAPLLFKLFNAIDQSSSKDWFRMPKGVNFRHVCSESGLKPNDYCHHQVIDYYIPGISDYQECQHMKSVFVALDSAQSYCTACLPESGYIKALYPNHAPDLIAYFEAENINYLKTPPHNESCERVFAHDAPKITSPVDRLEYLVDKEDSLQVMLSCQAANNVDQVFWYINDQFYTSANVNEQVYFTPNEGQIKISCADDRGRNTDISIDVKLIRF